MGDPRTLAGVNTSPRRSIAFLGLGRMGARMAGRLLNAGHSLVVWNRSPGPAAVLAGRGAHAASSAAEAGRGARVLFTMLADAAAVEAVLFDGGAVAALEPGAVVVDCSTVGPGAARRLAGRCAERAVRFVEAPVLGSAPAAEQGTLTVLAGGEAEVVDSVEPLLRHLGKEVVRAGEVGSANTLKLAMNLLVGGLTELLAEAIVLAERSGLSTDVLRRALFNSVLSSPFIGYKAPQLLERRFDPLFTARLMLKDLDLVLGLARAGGLALPGTAAVREAYAAAVEGGGAEQDFAVVIERIAGEASVGEAPVGR